MTGQHRNKIAEAVQFLLDDRDASLEARLHEGTVARDARFDVLKQARAALEEGRRSRRSAPEILDLQLAVERADDAYRAAVRDVRMVQHAQRNLTRDPNDCMSCVLEHPELMASEARLDEFLRPRRVERAQKDLADAEGRVARLKTELVELRS